MAKPAPMTLARMRQIVGQRDVQLLTFSYFCLNYVFYLLGTWSFLYLVQERSFTGLESGFAGMLPWIGAGIGAGVGGFLSRRHGDADRLSLGLPTGADGLAAARRPAAAADHQRLRAPYAAVLALMATFFMIELNEGRVLGGDDARGTLGHRCGDGRAQHGRQLRRHRVGADHRRAVGRRPLERDVRDRRGVRVRRGGVLVRDRSGSAGGHRAETAPRGALS